MRESFVPATQLLLPESRIALSLRRSWQVKEAQMISLVPHRGRSPNDLFRSLAAALLQAKARVTNKEVFKNASAGVGQEQAGMERQQFCTVAASVGS